MGEPEVVTPEILLEIRLGDGVSAMGTDMARIAEYVLPRIERGRTAFRGVYLVAFMTIAQRRRLLRFLLHHNLQHFKVYDQGDRRVRNPQPTAA